MKFTILGFNQEESNNLGLDIEDLAILRWLINFMPKMKSEVIDNDKYFWVNYKAILEDLPTLKVTSIRSIRRKLQKMEDVKILKHTTIKDKGSYSYYAIGEKMHLILSNDVKENSTTQLAEDFDQIWTLYPRKDNKNTAFKHYTSWLKGKKYAGRTVKLTNRQMWFAVKKYADQCKENKTEKQYIKMGSTFFNESIYEYVEQE